MAPKISWRIHPRILDGFLLAVLIGYVFVGLSRVPFHGDESTFIRLSKDFAYLFQDRDIRKVVFRNNSNFWSEEQYQRVLTGAVDPLTIGMAWGLAGMDGGDLNGFWSWYPPGFDEWEFNARAGNMPSETLLNIARIPSTLFTALSIIAVFVIAFLLARSRPAAWLAAFLYATTPAILVNGRRAMQEGAMLFFTSLVVLCGVLLAREMRSAAPRRLRIAGGFGLLGLAAGCALAGKHTSALIIAPVYLALVLLILFAGCGRRPGCERDTIVRWLSGWAGSGLLGLSVFYILMPVWWSFPQHWLLLLCLSSFCFFILMAGSGWKPRIFPALSCAAVIGLTLFHPEAWTSIYQPIRIIIEEREKITRIHDTLGLILPTFGSRVGEMADQLLSARTQYYESLAWDSLEEEQAQIRIYEAAHLNGRGGGTGWGIILLALAAVGLAVLLFQQRGWGGFFLFLWFAVPAAGLLVVNTLAWQRYYLILIAPWSVLAGFAAVPLSSPECMDFLRRIPGRAGQAEKTNQSEEDGQ